MSKTKQKGGAIAPPEITVDEWLSALEQLSKDDEGLTFDEIQVLTNVGQMRLHKALKRLSLEGKMSVGYRNGRSITGQSIRTPVYKLC